MGKMEPKQDEVDTKGAEMKLENTQKNLTEDNDCQKSPVPDGFELPSMPKDYYDKIPKEQLDQLDGIRTKDLNAASEKKEDAVAKADDAYQTGKDAYSKAVREKDSATKSLETKSKNKKIELLRVYKEKLIGLLPKNCVATGKDNSPIEERVPPDKVAICIAELNKLLAEEDIDYLKKLKEIKVKLVDAENIWKKSETVHKSDTCEAKLTEAQAIERVDVVWRSSLSKLMEQFK